MRTRRRQKPQRGRDNPTPAQKAREKAGYGGSDGLKRAARKLKFSARYIRDVEMYGGGSDRYCPRAARLFQCSGNLFFFPPEHFASWHQPDTHTISDAGRASNGRGKAPPLSLRRPACR